MVWAGHFLAIHGLAWIGWCDHRLGSDGLGIGCAGRVFNMFRAGHLLKRPEHTIGWPRADQASGWR
jgi:hypothetical protein